MKETRIRQGRLLRKGQVGDERVKVEVEDHGWRGFVWMWGGAKMNITNTACFYSVSDFATHENHERITYSDLQSRAVLCSETVPVLDVVRSGLVIPKLSPFPERSIEHT